MRKFIPPHIFSSSIDSLEREGVSTALAKHLLATRCLWFIRMHPQDIARLHPSDLHGRYTVVDHAGLPLDAVELAAIYYSSPNLFLSDNEGKKKIWLDMLELVLRQKISAGEHRNKTKHNKLYLQALPSYNLSSNNMENEKNEIIKYSKNIYDSGNVGKISTTLTLNFSSKKKK